MQGWLPNSTISQKKGSEREHQFKMNQLENYKIFLEWNICSTAYRKPDSGATYPWWLCAVSKTHLKYTIGNDGIALLLYILETS